MSTPFGRTTIRSGSTPRVMRSSLSGAETTEIRSAWRRLALSILSNSDRCGNGRPQLSAIHTSEPLYSRTNGRPKRRDTITPAWLAGSNLWYRTPARRRARVSVAAASNTSECARAGRLRPAVYSRRGGTRTIDFAMVSIPIGR